MRKPAFLAPLRESIATLGSLLVGGVAVSSTQAAPAGYACLLDMPKHSDW